MAANGGDSEKKRRHAKYLPQANKRKKSTVIPFGRQGFIVTCDGGREKQTSHEVINLLDEFYERYVKQNGIAEAANVAVSTENENVVDAKVAENEGEKSKEASKKSIDDLLQDEITELRDKDKTRFVNFPTGCNGVVFIDMLKGSEVTPGQLAEFVIRTVAASKKSRTRFCMKLLPVEITCYSSGEELKKAAESFVLKHFPADAEKGMTFGVVYESRANSGLDRMEIIKAVAGLVPSPHSVNLKDPQKTIIVQVAKTTCTIGVVTGFKELAKYNLRQLTLIKNDDSSKSENNNNNE